MGAHDLSATGSTLLVLLQNPEDQRAWAKFVLRYGPMVYAWCRRWGLQESDAEDVTQEVLTKLYCKIGGFAYDPAKGSFRGWLKTVAHHAWRDAVEARRRPGAGAAGGSAALDQLQAVAARDDLAESLEREFDGELYAAAAERVRGEVSARDWKIFAELAIVGRPGKEVAEELGMKVAAVFVAKSRVQQRLREAVRELDPQGDAG
jgi:RNA polymerase sigma-70 factor (ECF subfamily)